MNQKFTDDFELSEDILDDFFPIRSCRICGCTDEDCRQCIENTGGPCHWVEDDLCSACADELDLHD